MIFYKGQQDKNSLLKEDDFMIVVQTTLQKHMMDLYSSKGICTDATHGTTGYDFKLISYLVVDDLDKGFPVAWCISNREDYGALNVFNKVIKDNNDGMIS